MKNSGIEWIGNIPNDWKLESLKGHLEEVKESNDPVQTTQVLSLTNKLGVIPYEEKGEKGNKAKENYNEYKLAYPNTIVANSMNILIGSVGICNYFGCVSPVYYVFKPKNENELKFLDYIFQSQPFQKELRRYAKGILEIRLRVSASDILRRQVACPTIEKQKQITAFIDEKCGKIDELIANQEKQIEKLKEYKQSVITEAVTKGLDKSAPLKDSGIEWIGKIPEIWNVSKVSLFYDVVLGKMLQSVKNNEQDTYEHYICAANLGNNTLKMNDLKRMWFSAKEKEHYNIQKGDLIVVEGGDVASCDIVKEDVSNVYIQNAVHRVRAKDDFSLSFLRYSLIMSKAQGYVSLICNKATIAHFTKDKLMSLPLIVVPVEEQQQIVNYLDGKCLKIDRLIAIKQEKIEKLQEYKKSLIYEYVTGKKEVV